MAARVSASRLAAAGSDPGRERENNEDRVLCDPERGIYAVVDGVGGESGGEVAAQTAVEILHARLSRQTSDAGQRIREAIALANKKIWELAQSDPTLRGMACVLTVAVADGNRVTVGHVGDSRLYLLRPGEIRKVTRDHSPVGVREDGGELSEREAMQHPRRNEIFRDVGSAPHEPDEEGFVDLSEITLPADGALLLCSDGLSDLVTARRALALVEANAADPGRAVEALIAEANAEGGKDNVSIVLVQGERFAAAVRSGQGSPAVPAATRGPLPQRPLPARRAAAGGARSRSFGPLRWAASRPAFLLYGALLSAFVLSGFTNPLRLLQRGGMAGGGELLRVGVGDGGYLTIGEALSQAASGDTVEVGPGEYRESIRLKAGVVLRSRMPRGAVLLPPNGSSEPVVSAEEVGGARLVGFRIAGDARQRLAVGLRLVAARVSVEGVEIQGAGGAAVEISGEDRSELRYCFLHDNPGTGVVAGAGGTDLRHNLIQRNGRGAAGAHPGIEVREGAQPQLVDNRIEGNGAGGVLLPGAERADEVFAWNVFGADAKASAVRIVGIPVPQAAPPPAAAPPTGTAARTPARRPSGRPNR